MESIKVRRETKERLRRLMGSSRPRRGGASASTRQLTTSLTNTPWTRRLSPRR
ncbi:hypothetical protein [Pyrobaculum arsenaticum]|uniref:Uncharacterized protein n=1 Tax=Pyrobaculum arsenaticum TaxID=121277 RepID=A0A7L4PA62_9CREN|nr:hypothetical protein [Pyrobaculum arsenaticum]NYR15849.1 hypothetical protein [Pyrobaculum arsenaticum]